MCPPFSQCIVILVTPSSFQCCCWKVRCLWCLILDMQIVFSFWNLLEYSYICCFETLWWYAWMCLFFFFFAPFCFLFFFFKIHDYRCLVKTFNLAIILFQIAPDFFFHMINFLYLVFSLLSFQNSYYSNIKLPDLSKPDISLLLSCSLPFCSFLNFILLCF